MVFKKGEAANPKGRPPGYQDFIVRAKYLLGQYDIGQIKEFITDPTKFDRLSVFDGMIMRRVVEAISADGNQSMNSLLDRLLGKPSQTIEQKVDATIQHKGLSHTSEWIEEMLGTGQTIPLTQSLPN